MSHKLFPKQKICNFTNTKSLTKPSTGNRVVILDHKIYSNVIQKIVSDRSKLENLNEYSSLKREASLQLFLSKLNLQNFLVNMIRVDFTLLILLLMVSLAMVKCSNFPLVIYFLSFVKLFHI